MPEPAAIAELWRVQRALLAWHAEHSLQAPWRQSRDPYQCLIAAVMAQQTQMSRVLPSYERFIAAFPSLESLACATAGDVIRVWDGMGYNTRAVRLHRAARTIFERGWPPDPAALMQIEGIGPFTAAVIASFAFGERAACVDTNVRRVLGRLAGDTAIDGPALQHLADASCPAGEPARWNQAVMDYGARVCTSRPKCGECVVAGLCPSRDHVAGAAELRDGSAPYLATRPRPAKRQAPFQGSTRWYRGRIVALLRQLPRGDRIRIDALPALIENGANPLPPDTARALVQALARDGLASIVDGAVALPD